MSRAKALGALDLCAGLGVLASQRLAWRRWRESPAGRPSDLRLLAELSLPLGLATTASAVSRRTGWRTRFGLQPKAIDPVAGLAVLVGAQVLGGAVGALAQATASPEPTSSRRPPAWYDAFAPANEELVFRGLLLSGASAWVGARRAVLGQAALFGAMHLKGSSRSSAVHALQAGSVGVAAGAVTAQQRGRLLPAMGAHYVFNVAGPRLNDWLERRGASQG